MKNKHRKYCRDVGITGNTGIPRQQVLQRANGAEEDGSYTNGAGGGEDCVLCIEGGGNTRTPVYKVSMIRFR